MSLDCFPDHTWKRRSANTLQSPFMAQSAKRGAHLDQLNFIKQAAVSNTKQYKGNPRRGKVVTSLEAKGQQTKYTQTTWHGNICTQSKAERC